MSSKSYSTTSVTDYNNPKTLAVQDEGILLEGGSKLSLYDNSRKTTNYNTSSSKTSNFVDNSRKTTNYDYSSTKTSNYIDNSKKIFNSVEIDEDAVAKAFQFADSAFSKASENTEKAMNLMGIVSNNEQKNMQTALDFANATFLAGSNIMNDALHYKASEQALSNENKVESKKAIQNIMSPDETEHQILLYYGAAIAGLFILYKTISK